MDTKLNVAVVAQAYAPVLGGAQRQIEALGPLFERRGIGVSVVTRRPSGTPARERQPGVDVHRVWVPASRAGASVAFSLGGARTVLRLDVDLIYAQDLLSSSTAALFGGLTAHLPIVVKVLSTGPRGDVDRLLHKPLGAVRLRTILRRSAGFACLSNEVESELLNLGAAPQKLFRIHNGVDTEHFRPGSTTEAAELRRKLGVAQEDVVFLYCGRFSDTKRVDVLLRAFAAVPGRLLLAGEGKDEPLLRQLIRAPDLAGRVSMLGRFDDPAPLYRAADIYVTASSTEGMSGSVLEAMASGVPIVTFPASGMRDLVDDDGGIVVEPETPSALAAAMRRLAADVRLRAQAGAAARERCIRGYSLEGAADRLATLFGSLVRSARKVSCS